MKNPPPPFNRENSNIPVKNENNYQSIPQNENSDYNNSSDVSDQIQAGFIKKV